MAIHKNLFDSVWEFLSSFGFKISANVALRENHYKILHQWYLTPNRLTKMFPRTLDICWRCGEIGADFLHIWWSCRLIQPFWKNIRLKLQERLWIRVPFNVKGVLLHSFCAWSQGMKYGDMLAHLLCTASLILAGNWKRAETPSLEKWEAKARYIFLMAKLSVVVKLRNGFPQAIHPCRKQWVPFIKHTNHYRLSAAQIVQLIDIVQSCLCYCYCRYILFICMYMYCTLNYCTLTYCTLNYHTLK